MNRDQVRGQLALKRLDQMIEPQSFYVGSNAKHLYKLEEQRSAIIEACAKEWAKLFDIPEDRYWQQSLPQVLHDILDNYEVSAAVVAAEAFLKRLGWKVERPREEV